MGRTTSKRSLSQTSQDRSSTSDRLHRYVSGPGRACPGYRKGGPEWVLVKKNVGDNDDEHDGRTGLMILSKTQGTVAFEKYQVVTSGVNLDNRVYLPLNKFETSQRQTEPPFLLGRNTHRDGKRLLGAVWRIEESRSQRHRHLPLLSWNKYPDMC